MFRVRKTFTRITTRRLNGYETTLVIDDCNGNVCSCARTAKDVIAIEKLNEFIKLNHRLLIVTQKGVDKIYEDN